MLPEGPPRWPPADEAIRAALEQAYRDGSWGQYHGPHCAALIERVSELLRTEFVTTCCSGTVAVELALRGLKVGPGDEVILAGYDFGGNFHCIEAIGAHPVLVDVEPSDWNLAPRWLAEATSESTRAVLVSHLHGGLVPMPEVIEFAGQRGIGVVEDACQVPGATVAGRPAGTWGDVGVWSFGGSKLLSAGRGGAVFTRRADVHQRIRLFNERGNQAYPLSELQAAVLLPQLDQLDERNARRGAAVAKLAAQLDALPGLRTFRPQAAHSQAAYYKLGLQYDATELADTPRDEFVAAMRAEGVAVDAGFRDFTRRSDKRCRKVGSLSESRRAGEGTLVLHHPVLLAEDETIDRVAKAFEKVCRAFASRRH